MRRLIGPSARSGRGASDLVLQADDLPARLAAVRARSWAPGTALLLGGLLPLALGITRSAPEAAAAASLGALLPVLVWALLPLRRRGARARFDGVVRGPAPPVGVDALELGLAALAGLPAAALVAPLAASPGGPLQGLIGALTPLVPLLGAGPLGRAVAAGGTAWLLVAAAFLASGQLLGRTGTPRAVLERLALLSGGFVVGAAGVPLLLSFVVLSGPIFVFPVLAGAALVWLWLRFR